MFRALLVAVSMTLALPSTAAAQGKPDKAAKESPKKTKAELARAAALFEDGQELYAKGRYAEAIPLYRAAHDTAPHPSALFNIARCHENLANLVKALEYYEKALEISINPVSITDIKGRIARLQARPTKVFVTTLPPGATMTVDGREAPEPGVSPGVLHLKPGEHVLLLRKEGFHMEARRVVVELGKEQPVQVKLRALPRACLPQKECPKPKKCPEFKLTDTYNLHLNLSVIGAFGFQQDRPVSGGPGIAAFVTFKNVMVGPTFLFFPGGENPLDGAKPFNGVNFTQSELRWILALVEAGYAFTFDTSYIYVRGGLGLSLDQIIYKGTYEHDTGKPNPSPPPTNIMETRSKSITEQEAAFTWVVGAGVEGFAASWISLGAGFRFGVIHGTRLDSENPGQTEDGSFPMGSVWGTVTLHL